MRTSKVKSKTEDILQSGVRAFSWWRNGALPHALLSAEVEEELEFRLRLARHGTLRFKGRQVTQAGSRWPQPSLRWPISFKSPSLWLVGYCSWLELCPILSFVMFLSNVSLIISQNECHTELKEKWNEKRGFFPLCLDSGWGGTSVCTWHCVSSLVPSGWRSWSDPMWSGLHLDPSCVTGSEAYSG